MKNFLGFNVLNPRRDRVWRTESFNCQISVTRWRLFSESASNRGAFAYYLLDRFFESIGSHSSLAGSGRSVVLFRSKEVRLFEYLLSFEFWVELRFFFHIVHDKRSCTSYTWCYSDWTGNVSMLIDRSYGQVFHLKKRLNIFLFH